MLFNTDNPTFSEPMTEANIILCATCSPGWFNTDYYVLSCPLLLMWGFFWAISEISTWTKKASSHVSSTHPLCLSVQRGAMKGYTCATMTMESLGVGSTCGVWSSAPARQGRFTVEECDTQVKNQLLLSSQNFSHIYRKTQSILFDSAVWVHTVYSHSTLQVSACGSFCQSSKQQQFCSQKHWGGISLIWPPPL